MIVLKSSSKRNSFTFCKRGICNKSYLPIMCCLNERSLFRVNPKVFAWSVSWVVMPGRL